MHLIQILSLVLPLNLKLYSEAFKHLRVISQKKKKKKKHLQAKSNHKSINLHLIFVNFDSI